MNRRNNNLFSIALTDAVDHVELSDDTNEMLRQAMRRTSQFWLSDDDDLRMRAAVGAVMCKLGYGDERYDRLCDSLQALRQLGATLNALSAGVDVPMREIPEAPYNILALWNEVTTNG